MIPGAGNRIQVGGGFKPAVVASGGMMGHVQSPSPALPVRVPCASRIPGTLQNQHEAITVRYQYASESQDHPLRTLRHLRIHFQRERLLADRKSHLSHIDKRECSVSKEHESLGCDSWRDRARPIARDPDIQSQGDPQPHQAVVHEATRQRCPRNGSIIDRRENLKEDNDGQQKRFLEHQSSKHASSVKSQPPVFRSDV